MDTTKTELFSIIQVSHIIQALSVHYILSDTACNFSYALIKFFRNLTKFRNDQTPNRAIVSLEINLLLGVNYKL